MIVGKDQSACIKFQCAANEFTWKDRGFVDRAVTDDFIGDQATWFVQKERSHLLTPQMGETDPEIICHQHRVIHQRSGTQFALQSADLDVSAGSNSFRRVDTDEMGEPIARGVQHIAERAELIDQ